MLNVFLFYFQGPYHHPNFQYSHFMPRKSVFVPQDLDVPDYGFLIGFLVTN